MRWLLTLLAVLSGLFVVVGAAPLLLLREHHPLYDALGNLGGFAAGAWALAAGFLAVFVALFVSETERMSRRREVAATCLAELRAFWDFVAKQEVLKNLQVSIGNLERLAAHPPPSPPPGASKLTIASYRGHLGRSWLSLQTASPEVFGALPVDVAQMVAGYYSQTRNVYGLLNWLNDQNFAVGEAKLALVYAKRAESELRLQRDGFSAVERKLAKLVGDTPKES